MLKVNVYHMQNTEASIFIFIDVVNPDIVRKSMFFKTEKQV